MMNVDRYRHADRTYVYIFAAKRNAAGIFRGAHASC